MAHPYYPSRTPTFNHVAMSVPGDLLDAEHRKEIASFWSEVFGFNEIPMMTIDRRRLVLSCLEIEQFIFLIAGDEAMHCPRMDHFGFSVGTKEELVAARDRAVAYRERDDRVDLIDLSADAYDSVTVHSIYVGYLLPMMCELQWWEFTGPRPTLG
jgi:hypothetical protein